MVSAVDSEASRSAWPVALNPTGVTGSSQNSASFAAAWTALLPEASDPNADATVSGTLPFDVSVSQLLGSSKTKHKADPTQNLGDDPVLASLAAMNNIGIVQPLPAISEDSDNNLAAAIPSVATESISLAAPPATQPGVPALSSSLPGSLADCSRAAIAGSGVCAAQIVADTAISNAGKSDRTSRLGITQQTEVDVTALPTGQPPEKGSNFAIALDDPNSSLRSQENQKPDNSSESVANDSVSFNVAAAAEISVGMSAISDTDMLSSPPANSAISASVISSKVEGPTPTASDESASQIQTAQASVSQDSSVANAFIEESGEDSGSPASSGNTLQVERPDLSAQGRYLGTVPALIRSSLVNMTPSKPSDLKSSADDQSLAAGSANSVHSQTVLKTTAGGDSMNSTALPGIAAVLAIPNVKNSTLPLGARMPSTRDVGSASAAQEKNSTIESEPSVAPARGAQGISPGNDNEVSRHTQDSKPAAAPSGPNSSTLQQPQDLPTGSVLAAIQGLDSPAPVVVHTLSSGATAETSTVRSAHIPVPDIPAVSTMGPVQMAQILTKATQAEMRIGMNTNAFGTIEVHTVLHANEVGVAIGSERGDLHSFLANDLPAIANTLQQQNLRLNQVSFHEGFGFSANTSSQGNSQSHSFASPTLMPSRYLESNQEDSVDQSAVAVPSNWHNGLSILA